MEKVRDSPTVRRIRTLPFRLASPTGRPARLGRVGLPSGLAVVLCAILLAAPSAAGIRFPPARHGAPFHGTLHIGHVITSLGCGASASFPVAPTFNLTSGIGAVSEKSSAAGCGPAGFSDFAATEAIAGFDSTPFSYPKAAAKNLSFNFTPDFVVNMTATPMSPGGGPYAWASFYLVAYGVLWDLTTGSVANSIGSLYYGTTNLSASGYYNHSWSFTTGWAWIPGNFTGLHQYFVAMYFIAFEYTSAPSHTPTSATARLNMATGGHHYKAGFWQIG
ncbi:MAG TPA: hypothetical protein VN864_00095 [Thermoplasmata archaeon]|nr:hypothetical protein [Thermoplasmata archaeon]